jgi:UDP-N-acetyl-D-galactosamine dehydrogenase
MNTGISNHFAVVGLGYVGLGLAIGLSKIGTVVGYDINPKRIETLTQGHDLNELFSPAELAEAFKTLRLTDHISGIQSANFYILSVATPAYYEMPDLKPLIAATEQVASVLKQGDIVVFESTVYPGITEDLCMPILEKGSQLRHGVDFHMGYSPERINPGDQGHTLKSITKIVSADDKEALKRIEAAYRSICDKVYPVSNIRTAEAIKLLENTQRDVNIALMNEFCKIMHALDIDMHEVIEGAKTKWGFIPFKPGFVGGHCISIDPHYLAFKAKRCGVEPDLILAARKVNDGMSQFVIQAMLKLLIKHQVNTEQLRIGLFGITYKENVVDVRNSMALKLRKELLTYGFECLIHDPMVQAAEHPAISLTDFEHMRDLSVAIIVVGHDAYQEQGLKQILSCCGPTPVVLDISNLFVEQAREFPSLIYWNL